MHTGLSLNRVECTCQGGRDGVKVMNSYQLVNESSCVPLMSIKNKRSLSHGVTGKYSPHIVQSDDGKINGKMFVFSHKIF